MNATCAVQGCGIADDLHRLDGADLCSKHAKAYMESGEGKRAEKLARVACADFIRRVSAEQLHSPHSRPKPHQRNGVG